MLSEEIKHHVHEEEMRGEGMFAQCRATDVDLIVLRIRCLHARKSWLFRPSRRLAGGQTDSCQSDPRLSRHCEGRPAELERSSAEREARIRRFANIPNISREKTMPKFGYKLMTESMGQKRSWENAIRAENAGVDSSLSQIISILGSNPRGMPLCLERPRGHRPCDRSDRHRDRPHLPDPALSSCHRCAGRRHCRYHE